LITSVAPLDHAAARGFRSNLFSKGLRSSHFHKRFAPLRGPRSNSAA